MKSDNLPPSLTAMDIGVWRIILERPKSYFTIPGKQTLQLWKDTITSVSGVLVQLFHDLSGVINPWIFTAFLFTHFLIGMERALRLLVESRVLDVIEQSFMSGSPRLSVISYALGWRIGIAILSSVVDWTMTRIRPTIKSAIIHHFQSRILEANLQQDFSSHQENSSKITINPFQAYACFSEVLDTVDLIFSIVSQIGFVLNFSRNQDQGLLFAILCIAKPIMNVVGTENLWDKTFIAYSTNAAYSRLMAMYALATGKQNKQEILTCGLEDYIRKEYTHASKECEGVTDDHPSMLYGRKTTPSKDVILELMGELPIIYYIFSCFSRPSKFSIATLAMLHQTAASLRWTFESIAIHNTHFTQYMNKMRYFYEHHDTSSKEESKEELFVYPSNEKEQHEGMEIKLKNVSFHYPGTPSTKLVLKSLSFTLPPSSLVVIVGSNGSGKSTLVKLLTNLYKPSSGTIYIDSKPSTSYISSSLFRSSALLTQDHNIFPVSMLENITIGDPDCEKGEEKTRRAKESARLGGAIEAIEKIGAKKCEYEGEGTSASKTVGEDGWNKIVQPVQSIISSHWPMPNENLKEIMDNVEKQLDLSGGEKQRLAASRTFMRLLSGSTKLAVVDEPTSAMDPEGELQLFNNLRSMRHGKTMIFVTHRFGHLTKYADIILCMKDGELVESGNHLELMEKKGEYHKLYNIQATAFTERLPSTSVPSIVVSSHE
ncbi:Type 1 protein exporter [Abortiporus biennis]